MLVAVVVIGYLLGSIPFGLLLTQAAGLGDIRTVGSGNIGATNVLRTGSKGLAAATLLLDGAEGRPPPCMSARSRSACPAVLFGGLAAVVGHLFPVWLGFRGGKGVATGLGVLLAASPVVGAAACVIWLAAAFLSKRSSVAALAAFAAAPFIAAALVQPFPIAVLALATAILVFLRHGANIRRLVAGTEPRIGERL